MNKKEKIHFILKTLDHYFPNPKIPLAHEDPYTLLIAVMLSAQCTDERVNQVTPHLFKLAKTPYEMIKLPEEEIYQIIKPCGLGRNKAKAILKMSFQLIEKFFGKVPSNLEELEALAGVGHKTASVVMIQSFEKPAFPVDTHIHRLAKRWKLSKGQTVKKTEEDLKKAFPKDKWALLHLQIIYFARKFCPARAHQVEKCPICSILCLPKAAP
jgi:endonuclease-3